MTNQKGVDVGIQTESHWEDPKQRKYRRLKHKVLEFIAKHKSAQSSVDKANRRVQVLQQEKRRLMRANKNGGIGNTIATDDEVDQLVDEDEEMAGVSPTPKPRRVTGSRRKPVEVARDEDGKVILPVQIASLKVIELGTVVHDRPGFHSERYIWPVGYTVERTYMSMVDAENQSTYTCKVEDGGDGPTFTIQAADTPDEEVISARTPTGAWATVIKRANEVRKRESANAISGPEYFGFSNPLVAEMIEALPNADECQYYVARSKR
ncbi:protein [Lichtheimia corymbifera JMRC:FSU:9682]|uniref:Protein n=1 Tax=Lichtheimia corymbifera JMRC:FSU:9682 TaxID=1263082 RepID=A0A068RKU8_9FUNG|nr:protein [Lichtheimia corymbifera JMRC:FSU:9682]